MSYLHSLSLAPVNPDFIGFTFLALAYPGGPGQNLESRKTVVVVAIVVQYELYELYDWGKVLELYGTLQ